MIIRILIFICLSSITPLSADEKPTSNLLMVDDFNQGNQNRLGGYFNKFEKIPSSAIVTPTKDVFRGDSGKSLRVTAKKGAGGYCGMWMQFFDFKAEEKSFLNVYEYAYLSFWVKGEQGGEKFIIKLADKRWIEIDDSLAIGPVTRFLPEGVTQTWTEVLVPLSQARNLNLSKLGGMTLDFAYPGEQTVYIDDVAFKTAEEVPTPYTAALSDTAQAAMPPIPPRTAWSWHVDDILFNKNDAQSKLFDFCQRENVNRIWLQIPARYEPVLDMDGIPQTSPPEGFKITLRHEDELRAFIRKAHARGIKIEALDGYPEFAQRPYHFVVYAMVDAIIDYNNRVAPEERYSGIHLDNEPYLIIGWHYPARREQILEEFLALNVECQRRVSAQSDMVYGIDVPFWWSALDTETGEPIGIVSFNGERKPAVHFCIDLLDNLGIMNYRDTAYGADSMLSHGSPILEYAEKKGKRNIYSGVEVFTYKPTTVWFALGIPHNDFYDAMKTNAHELSYLSRIDGFRTQMINDGKNIHVGIELPENPDAAMQEKMLTTVTKISEQLGVESREHTQGLRQKMAKTVTNYIKTDPEWLDYQEASFQHPESGKEIPGFKAISIMLPKITFADESYAEYRRQINMVEHEFVNFSSFRGTAIHYHKVLEDKYQGDKAAN